VQELLTMQGVPRWGIAAYTGLSLLGGLALAVLSWHLVERPALQFKDWTPRLLDRWNERWSQFRHPPQPRVLQVVVDQHEPVPGPV
jgi:peptidoglycan/LPS O-acetylase OafA/YrhL